METKKGTNFNKTYQQSIIKKKELSGFENI
jgi:hypothetical protein